MKLGPHFFSDMKDYGVEKTYGYRYIFALIDKFSKIVWLIPLQNRYSRSKTVEFRSTLEISKRDPKLIETDDCKENVNKMFKKLLKQNDVKRCSRYTPDGAVFAGIFKTTTRNSLKKPSFSERKRQLFK